MSTIIMKNLTNDNIMSYKRYIQLAHKTQENIDTLNNEIYS
jgi:hypothetical protein